MRHMSAEETHNMALVETLRAKITQFGRWHLKGRKYDSTRIWKKLFRDIEDVLNEKYPFSEKAFIRLIVYPQHNQYSFMVHRHSITCYHGYVAKRENDYEKIITALNSVLIHYNLTLSETAESIKNNSHRHFSGQREYEVKFVQNN